MVSPAFSTLKEPFCASVAGQLGRSPWLFEQGIWSLLSLILAGLSFPSHLLFPSIHPQRMNFRCPAWGPSTSYLRGTCSSQAYIALTCGGGALIKSCCSDPNPEQLSCSLSGWDPDIGIFFNLPRPVTGWRRKVECFFFTPDMSLKHPWCLTHKLWRVFLFYLRTTTNKNEFWGNKDELQ